MSVQETSPEAQLVAELAEFTLVQVTAWLRSAMRGERALPHQAPGELPHLGILRLTQALPSLTRRDLAAACDELVREVVADDGADPDYATTVLALAAKLEQHSVVGSLVAAVRDFPRRPRLPLAIKKRIVGTLLELRVRQPAEFWQTLLDREPALEGGAFAGLLRSDREAALAALPRLPERQSLADAVTLTLEHATEDMSKLERDVFLPRLLAIGEKCQPLLRATLTEWFEEAGYIAVAPTSDVRLARLRAVLARRIRDYEPSPESARLAA